MEQTEELLAHLESMICLTLENPTDEFNRGINYACWETVQMIKQHLWELQNESE